MSEQKSVLVPLLIGCGVLCLLSLLLCVGAWQFFVPRMMQQAEEMVEQLHQEFVRQQMTEAFPDGWRAPNDDATGEVLFPETVGNFSRLDVDSSPSPTDFGLSDLECERATYESALRDVDVYAYRVAADERRDQMQSTKDALRDNFTNSWNSSTTRTNYEVLSFSVSPPTTKGVVFASEGWLFLILSEDEFADEEFQTEFLIAIQPPLPDEAGSDEEPGGNDAADASTDRTDQEPSDELPVANEEDFPPPPPRPETLPANDATETVP
ncbi:MAG: hypothetical protein KDA93_14715 [Planctomycetaceae bacterium]|nr:hypothetical protein [Planctomycetaceae bacterium]